MEDLSVAYDYSVRDGRGKIVQCIYNGDGLDATYLETVRGKVVPVNIERAAVRFPGLTPIADLRDEVEALATKILGAAVAEDLMETWPAGDLEVADEAFLAECERRMHRARVEPGTMVGALAATAIGSPVSHHSRTCHLFPFLRNGVWYL